MLPSASWAYQSSVTSTGTPFSVGGVADDEGLDPVGDRLRLVRYLDHDLLLGALGVRLA